jgi:hypothetical protein
MDELQRAIVASYYLLTAGIQILKVVPRPTSLLAVIFPFNKSRRRLTI